MVLHVMGVVPQIVQPPTGIQVVVSQHNAINSPNPMFGKELQCSSVERFSTIYQDIFEFLVFWVEISHQQGSIAPSILGARSSSIQTHWTILLHKTTDERDHFGASSAHEHHIG